MKRLPFLEGLFPIPSSKSGKSKLLGSRCRDCQEITFPQRNMCPNCFKKDLECIALSTTGHLFTFTISHQGPKNFATPYASGYIDLPEGVRIYSLLAEWSGRRLEPGLKMELCFEKIGEDAEGNELIIYKFRPLY